VRSPILRLRALSPVSKGGIEVVIRKKQAAAKMSAGSALGGCPENHPQVLNSAITESTAAYLRAPSALTSSYVRNTKSSIVFKIRIQRNVQEATLILLGRDLRQARNRIILQYTVSNQAKGA
jgi:hypothetical protein